MGTFDVRRLDVTPACHGILQREIRPLLRIGSVGRVASSCVVEAQAFGLGRAPSQGWWRRGGGSPGVTGRCRSAAFPLGPQVASATAARYLQHGALGTPGTSDVSQQPNARTVLSAATGRWA